MERFRVCFTRNASEDACVVVEADDEEKARRKGREIEGALNWVLGDYNGEGEIYDVVPAEPGDRLGDMNKSPLPEAGASRISKAQRAYALLLEARDLLREAGATRALDKVRAILPSCQGAVRAAGYRDNREYAKGRAEDEAISDTIGDKVLVVRDAP